MIESAAVLFSERGLQGTSLTDVLTHSGAPRGSVYHHFSGGKPELVEEATRWAGEVTIAGWMVLCRAQRSLLPLARVCGELELVMASALAGEQLDGVATPSVEE